MANEIALVGSLSVNRNGANTVASASASITQTGTDYGLRTQNVGTAAELIDKGDIGTVGYLFIKNLDPTNYVELALDSGATQIFAKLLPGEFAIIPTRQQPYGKANTAACDCLVLMIEL